MRHKSRVNLLNPRLPSAPSPAPADLRNAIGDAVTLTDPCPTCHAVAWEVVAPGYAVCGVCHPARQTPDHRQKGAAA